MNDFKFPMKKREKIAGWIYLPVHTVLMSLIILPVIVVVCAMNGITVTNIQMNTLYYCTGLAFVLIFMWSFLRENFVATWKCNPLSVVWRGVLAYYLMGYVVNFALIFFATDLVNPNTEAVTEAVGVSLPTMFAVAVLMAPIVEEVLFRGVIFGTIRTRNRLLAYIVSTLVFAAYHLWASVITYQDWTILIYMLQYLPAGLTLAWAYERSGSIWGSIFLHMVINSIAVIVSAL